MKYLDYNGLKYYNSKLSFVHLVITCDSSIAGATITATNGSITKTAVAPSGGGTVTINVNKLGTWTISESKNKSSKTVNATYYGNYSCNIGTPIGASVTPVNDIQTWLKCAELSKSYTTIAQVLADSTTLSSLISNNNATDYLVRSTSWVSNIVGNQNAMTYIGNNNYCSNKLLANDTWLTAINGSIYFEKILNVKVPTMTSDTAPSGQVFYSSQLTYQPRYGYQAFDKNNTNIWSTADYSQNNCYIGYKFPSATCVKKFTVTKTASSTRAPKNFKLQGSDNNSTWTDVSDVFAGVSTQTTDSYKAKSTKNYAYYRLFIATNYGDGADTEIAELQFYGRTI